MSDLNESCRIALDSYISQARSMSIYGGEAGWSSKIWTSTTLRNPVSMVFCEWRSHGRYSPVWLKSPFMEFAKAYVRHQQTQREVGSIGDSMNALRALYVGLIKIHGAADILKVDGSVQEAARQQVAEWYVSESHKPTKIGLRLMAIYDELRRKGIHPALPHWQSPWRQMVEKHLAMDEKSVSWRREKAPSDEKLAALLEAFERAESDKDQFWASAFVLLAFAPNRGGELVDLKIDSLIDEVFTDKYGRQKRRVGVQWFSEKGFGPTVKWVPRLTVSNGDQALETKLMDMVVEAFARLKRISAPAREAAKLAHDSNGTAYPIHENCVTPEDYPQDRILSDYETAAAMGRLSSLGRAGQGIPFGFRNKTHFGWHFPCVEHGNPTYRDIAQADFDRFKRAFCHWPFTSDSGRVKVWENPLLHRWNQFCDNPHRKEYPNSWMIANSTRMNIQLSSKWVDGVLRQTSLFDRLSIKLSDGSDVKLTSHDFRRWHGTRGRALATKGLTEHMLRMLAGRQNIRQNDAYDFNTPKERADAFKKLLADPSDNIPLHKRLEVGLPIHRHELEKRSLRKAEVIEAIQISEMGACTHSILESPCMKGGDCLPCSEKKYVKGTPGCLSYLERQAAFHKSEFDALEDWQKRRDQLGLDQWMTYHVIRYAIAESLVRQMKDPDIPDGTVIAVDEKFDPSPLKVNLSQRGISVPQPSVDPVSRQIDLLLGVDDA